MIYLHALKLTHWYHLIWLNFCFTNTYLVLATKPLVCVNTSTWNILSWAFIWLLFPAYHPGFIWNVTYSKVSILDGLQSGLLLSLPVILLCFKFLLLHLSIRAVSLPITKAVINKIYTAIHQTEVHVFIIRRHVIEYCEYLRTSVLVFSLPHLLRL